MQSLITDLERYLATESVSSLSRLAQEHEIRQLLQQIPSIASESSARDETALACSQKIVQLLYRSETALAREVYVFLLERLCSFSGKVAKEVTAWLVYAEDERKFNVPVTTALINARLINAAELDVQLAKFVTREYRPTVVDFAARFVAECLMETPPIATREQLGNSLEALAQASRLGKGTETFVLSFSVAPTAADPYAIARINSSRNYEVSSFPPDLRLRANRLSTTLEYENN